MRKGESMMEIDETKKLVSKVFNSFKLNRGLILILELG